MSRTRHPLPELPLEVIGWILTPSGRQPAIARTHAERCSWEHCPGFTEGDELGMIKADLRQLVAWPPVGYPRRSEAGMPTEVVYDQWAYERLVGSYRAALKRILGEA